VIAITGACAGVGRAAEHSPQLWTSMHRGWIVAGALVVVGALLAGFLKRGCD